MDEEPSREPPRPIGAVDAAILLVVFVLGPQALLRAMILALAAATSVPTAIARETVASHPIFGGVAQLLVGGAILAFARSFYARGRRFGDAFGLHAIPTRTVFVAVVAGATMHVPLAEIGNLLEEFVPVPLDEKLRFAEMLAPSSMLEGLGLVLAAVAVAPVVEELVFRGLMLPGIARGSGTAVGVIVSTLAFAIAHVRPGAVVTALVAGLLLAIVTIRRDSIVPAIVVHAANNAIPVVVPARLVPLVGVNVVADGPTHVHPVLVVLSLIVCGVAVAMLVQDDAGDDAG